MKYATGHINVMKVIRMNADGSRAEEEWPLPIPISTLKKAIGGGYPEFVRVLDGDAYVTMAVHSEGVDLGLPRNEAATQLYFANVRRAFPDSDDPAADARKTFALDVALRSNSRLTTINLGPQDGDSYIAGDVVVMPFPKEEVDDYVDSRNPSRRHLRAPRRY